MAKEYLESPIFYMGNKYKLLRQLIPYFPKKCNVFIDLFGGSGVVSMNYHGITKTIYNEFNPNVIGLIKMIVDNDPKELDAYWKSQIEKYNLETMSITIEDRISREGYDRRKDNYMKLRDDYNSSEDRNYKDLFLLLCYSINNLLRFNTDSDYNVSSGSGAYNERNYKKVCDLHNSFQDVEITQKDALSYDFSSLTKDDFIYFDPPYLNTTAVYNEKRAFGGWGMEHDLKMFKLLEGLNSRGIKWALSNVFVNRDTKNTHLEQWCKDNNWNVLHLHRNYNPFSRGNSDNDEVLIRNYTECFDTFNRLF